MEAIAIDPSIAGVLVVCTRRQLPETVTKHSACHVLALGSAAEGPPTGLNGAVGRWTERVFNDIAEPRGRLIMPSVDDVAAILEAGRAASEARQPLIVCCFAGVSRSTAAAYAIACDRHGPGSEDRLAWALRSMSPEATPNPAVIALADGRLGRKGAMIGAIAAMGRGAECEEGRSFAWHLDRTAE